MLVLLQCKCRVSINYALGISFINFTSKNMLHHMKVWGNFWFVSNWGHCIQKIDHSESPWTYLETLKMLKFIFNWKSSSCMHILPRCGFAFQPIASFLSRLTHFEAESFHHHQSWQYICIFAYSLENSRCLRDVHFQRDVCMGLDSGTWTCWSGLGRLVGYQLMLFFLFPTHQETHKIWRPKKFL